MKRLRNSTTVPDWLVKEIESFVMPPGGVGGYDVELRNTERGVAGYAYHAGSGYHKTGRPFVTLRIGRRVHTRGGSVRPGKGYLPFPALGSRLEGLVFLMAHELRHLWQARVPKGRRAWGSRGQFSERDADAYALRQLRRWRRESPDVWAKVVP